MDAGVWPEFAEPAIAAKAELAAIADSWLTDSPRAGVVGFVAERADRLGVDRTVLENSLRILLHAGYTSASKLLSLAAVTLLGEPGGLGRFRAADPVLATDELVRFESPVRALARVCVSDTSVASIPIRAGEVLTLFLGAANRDSARFTDADVLRLDRSPNPHLGFGRGAHSCMGAALAALQARVVFAALAERHPNARVVAEPVFRRNLTLRGLDALEVALHPSPQFGSKGQPSR